jgi:hypothetical protein
VALSETLKSLKNAHMRLAQATKTALELPFCDPIFHDKSFLTNTQSVLRPSLARRK